MTDPNNPAQNAANLPDEVRTNRASFEERSMRQERVDDHGRPEAEVVHDSWHSRFHIDPQTIPEGKIYHWAREKTYSESPNIDENNLMEYLQEGWEFVPANRHPNLCLEALLHGRNVKATDRIKRFGHVLMEMNVEKYRRIKQREQQASYDQMMSVKHSVPGAENPADFQMFFTKGNDINYSHALMKDKNFQ